MSGVVTGGCLCGGVRYAYSGEVGTARYCHCADCRRISGSAFGVSVRVNTADFRITRGTTKSFTKPGDSGRPVTRHFCPECGSPLFTEPPLHPETLFIKAGSLDDAALVRPDREAWTVSRVEWAQIEPGLSSFTRGRT
jgi:hypothetical protein